MEGNTKALSLTYGLDEQTSGLEFWCRELVFLYIYLRRMSGVGVCTGIAWAASSIPRRMSTEAVQQPF
jgi:hypothetical protein